MGFVFTNNSSFDYRSAIVNERLDSILHIKYSQDLVNFIQPNGLTKYTGQVDFVFWTSNVSQKKSIVHIEYKKMKTGGIRVNLVSDLSKQKYTVGEYQGKISFSNIAKHIYLLGYESAIGKVLKKETKKTSRSTKRKSALEVLPENKGDKLNFVCEKIVEKFSVLEKDCYRGTRYSTIRIPVGGAGTNVGISVEILGYWKDNQKIKVEIDTASVIKRIACFKGSRTKRVAYAKVISTTSNKINLDKIYSLITERVAYQKEVIKQEAIQKKQSELNTMIVDGFISSKFGDIKRDYSQTMLWKDSEYCGIDLKYNSTKEKTNTKLFNIELSSFANKELVLDENQVIKLINTLKEFGMLNCAK